jgi:VWFA-related protein
MAMFLACILPVAKTVAQTQSPSTAAQSASGFTLRTGTNLVVVDVTVTGPDGRPVHGLKASDFTVSEDHAAQRTRDFSETRQPAVGQAAVGQAAATPAPKLAPGLFTNYAAASDGPANILLLDMLNTPLRDQNYARLQIQDYLKHSPAGTQVAIFGLSNTLTMLQGFTSDPAILRAALAKKNALAGSSLLDDPLGGGGNDGAGATAVSDALANLGHTPDVLEMVANAQQFEAETASFRLQLRAQMTLDALNEIARYVANIPGRKNLIWFSGSFPINILGDTTTNNGFASMASSEEEFHETTSLLARARVALYPVDARGLFNSNTFSASTSGAKYVRNPAAVGKDEAKFEQELAADNTTMLQAAQDTGGHAFFNTNALSDAVAKAVSDGSSFYTLTYSPANKNWDGRFHSIEVKVDHPGYTLAYRRGYFVDDPFAAAKHVAAGAVDPAAQSVASRTMVRGAPVPTQIEFTVRVVPATGSPEAAVADGNQPTAANAEARPPFVRYAVDFAIDPRGFVFSQSNGGFHDAIQLVTFVYDRDGNLVNRAGSVIHADFSDAVYRNFVGHPVSFNQDVSVPTKGDYFLRIGVFDGNTDRAGAVELPVDSVKGLRPLDELK